MLKAKIWVRNDVVKMQNGYYATSTPAKTRLPLHKATSQASFPSSKIASEPPCSIVFPHACYNVSRDYNLDDPPNLPNLVISLAGLIHHRYRDRLVDTRPWANPQTTFTINAHGYQQHSRPRHWRYHQVSTLFDVGTQQSRWMALARTGPGDVSFLTSTPPLSPHKRTSRPTPASVRQPVLPQTLPLSDPWLICVHQLARSRRR